jgi:drug/metabolite transporter (DMT)-like permease
MFLIIIAYLVLACTFILAKTSLYYMQPFYFIAIRMFFAGFLLLGYVKLIKGQSLRVAKKDLYLFGQVMLFHIYGAFMLEFWSMQYLTSAKAALLYNLSPFITALLCYLLFKQKLTVQKWIALTMGFAGMLPIMMYNSYKESQSGSYMNVALPDLVLLAGVVCACYGWLVVRELSGNRNYSFVLVNGIGMWGGGIMALITAIFIEKGGPFRWYTHHPDMMGQWLSTHFDVITTTVIMAFLCMFLLIILANFIGYNLYAYLLAHYSPTFLSFAGFITPFLAGLLGCLFLGETISAAFLISFGITVVSLYVFYQDELTSQRIEKK